jgi:hypothetical protein
MTRVPLNPLNPMKRPLRNPTYRRAILATSLAAIAPAFPANISWQTPATVTSDSAISLNGFPVHAGNFRSSGEFTVAVGAESIVFENRPAQNAAGALLAGEEARVVQGAGGKQTNAALFNVTGTTVSANFDAVLDGSAWENADAGPAPGLTDTILRVTGVDGAALTQGQTYQIQVFYSDDRVGPNTRGQRYHDGLGNFSDPVIAGDSQGVIGTFTADATGYQDILVQNTTGGANFPVAVNAYVLRIVSNEDTDGDELPNLWEIANSLDPEDATGINGKLGDPDTDTFSNFAEYTAGSNPQAAASTPGNVDGDGLPDSWETTHFGGLGFSEFDDPDSDFAFNDQEFAKNTDPTDRLDAPDEEGGTGDGMGDDWEIFYFTDTSRLPAGDEDSDTVTNVDEWLNDSNPVDPADPFPGVTTVTWGTPVTVTDDSIIAGGGSLVHAGNFRSDNQEIAVTVGAQTITFENRQSQNAAGILLEGEEARVIAGSGGRQVNLALFDASGTTVSTPFESVLDGSAWENLDPGPAPGATDLVLRVAGVNGTPLTEGQEYRIQLLYSDDRPGSSTRAQVYHDGLNHSSATVLASSSSAVTGTFTATAAGYMDIYIRNTSGEANFPVGLNGYVLRAIVSGDSDGDGMPDAWELANGLNPNSNDAAGDLDGDGTTNFGEFAFKGAANNGASRGVNTVAVQDTNANGQKELTLTIAARNGATFVAGANGTMTASADGVAYTIRGSLDLVAFTSGVALVGTAPSDDSDYQLHTFRLIASEGLPGKGFLQATAIAAP